MKRGEALLAKLPLRLSKISALAKLLSAIVVAVNTSNTGFAQAEAMRAKASTFAAAEAPGSKSRRKSAAQGRPKSRATHHIGQPVQISRRGWAR
jgi:hypothetical protein